MFHLRSLAALAAISGGVASILVAAPHTVNGSPTTTPRTNCGDLQTTADIRSCQQREYQRVDAALDRAYQRLRRTGANRRALTHAQQAWTKFRDADCDFAAGAYEGGSLAGVIRSQCFIDSTRRRTRDLNVYWRFYRKQ